MDAVGRGTRRGRGRGLGRGRGQVVNTNNGATSSSAPQPQAQKVAVVGRGRIQMPPPTIGFVSREGISSEASTARQRHVQEQLFAELLEIVSKSESWFEGLDVNQRDDILRRFRILREGALSSGVVDEFVCSVYERSLQASRQCERWDEVQRCEAPLLDLIYPTFSSAGHANTLAGRLIRLTVLVSTEQDVISHHNIVDIINQVWFNEPLRQQPLVQETLKVVNNLLSSCTGITTSEQYNLSREMLEILSPFMPAIQQKKLKALSKAYMQLPVNVACRQLCLTSQSQLYQLISQATPNAKIKNDLIVFR